MAYRPAQYRPARSGFMEPIGRSTYYEDTYYTPKSKQEDGPEACGFDLCDSSDGEEKDKREVKAGSRPDRKRDDHTKSRGIIKRRKYKRRAPQEAITGSTFEQNAVGSSFMAKRRVQFKIAPGRNAKRSIILISSDEDRSESAQEPEEPHTPTSRSRATGDKQQTPTSVNTFSSFLAEKAQQQQLSGTARFEQARKQRREIRERRHIACQKARKVRERTRRDAEIDEACLVDEVPMPPKGFCVFIPKFEAPTDFVDCTQPKAKDRPKGRKEKSMADKTPIKNRKGEEMNLASGAAYVLITTDEQSR